MNGLRYIRKQCNFSLSQLAERLEVSRQIISAWENGKKEIPEMRKKQLADFFGIDKCFFDEISEEQKRILLDKAMFRYIKMVRKLIVISLIRIRSWLHIFHQNMK